MDQAQIREGLRAITAGVGRRKAGGGVRGAQVEKLRERLTAALTEGKRATGKGAGSVYNAASTAKMAARLIGVGGTVPDGVADRFAFGACVPGLRALAAGMGVDAEALIAALVRPADIAAAQAAQVEATETAAVQAAMDLDAPAPQAEPATVVHLVQQPDIAQPARRNSGRRR